MFFLTLLIWNFSWNFWLGKCKMWPHLVSLTLFYFPVLVLLYWCLTLSNLQNNNPHHCSRSYSDVDYYFALYYRIYFLRFLRISQCACPKLEEVARERRAGWMDRWQCLSDGVLTLCSCSGYSFHITAALDYPEESKQSFIAQLLGLNVYSVCSNATGYYKVFYMEFFFFFSSSSQLIYQRFCQTSNLFRLAMTRPQGDFIIQLITFLFCS